MQTANERAAEEGVDLVIAETNHNVGEAQIGLEVSQALDQPAMVTFTARVKTTLARSIVLSLRGSLRHLEFP